MKRFSTPGRRALLVCTAWLGLFSAHAVAAPTCPEVKFGGSSSMSVPDFDPVLSGGWTPGLVTVNGQPSSPNPQQGGVYQWSQDSGPAVTLINATTPKMDFLAPDVTAAGATVVVRLTVTGCGGSATGTYTINITDAHDIVVNAAPHAVAGASPAAPTEGQLVTLDGTSSWDPDDNPLTYSWEQTGGPSVVLANAGQAQATFLAPNVAATTTLTFRLTVSDGTLENWADVQVSVVWTNDPPVARLSCPLDVNEGASVTLNGSASSDSDDGIASYQWIQQVGLPIVPGVATWDTASVTFNAPSLGFHQTGLVPFVLTVTDGSGAASSATCYVFIHDVTPPLITGAQDLDIEATSADGAMVAYAMTAFDAVDGDLTPLLACEPPAGAFPFGATSVSCGVKDSAQNPASASFTVTVADTTAPVIDAPVSVGVEATGPDGAVVTFEATTTDAVDGPGLATCTPPSGSTFPVDDSTVSCTATDSHGNTATTSIGIHVLDTTPPALTLPPAQELEATSPAGAVATFTVSASDIVDGNVPVTCDRNSGDTFALGTATVQCQAVDAHGNIGNATFTITVKDTTPPSIVGVSDFTTEATSAAGAPAAYALPTANDIVDGPVVVNCLPAPGATFPLGTTLVQCTASDSHGNSAQASLNVSVIDTTPPTISNISDNLTVEATSPDGAAVPYVLPTAWDLVDGNVALVCAPVPGSTFALGYHDVVCTATDARGNSASAAFGVHVADTTDPVISYLGDVSAIAGSNSSAVVNYTQPTAWDIVDGAVPVTCMPESGSTFPMGASTVECTASDSHGNTATGSFQITVSYAWTGFFQPIDNTPALNTVKAGSAVPVKFSLGGNQGMGIFLSPPASGVIGCGATDGNAVEETVTAGSSSLQFDPGSNQYIYVWKTDKAWAGQCRILQLKLKDGNTRSALFKFK